VILPIQRCSNLSTASTTPLFSHAALLQKRDHLGVGATEGMMTEIVGAVGEHVEMLYAKTGGAIEAVSAVVGSTGAAVLKAASV
jgi:hypothetical protein